MPPTTAPTPRARFSLPPAVAAGLRWCGLAAYPLVLFTTITDGAGGPLGFDFLGYALPLLAVALPAVLLRRRPVATLVLMTLGAALLTFMVDPWTLTYLRDVHALQILGIDLVVGVIAAVRSRLVSVTAAVVTLLVQASLAAGGKFDHDDLGTVGIVLALAMAAAWTFGYAFGERRRQSAALRAQAAAQAVTDERLRIARELHDMVAHSIGVIAIQAGMGRRVIDSQPAQARAALAAIEDTSRETLAGLRRVLGSLRSADEEASPLAPAPGLADLGRLVDSAAAAGLRVEVERLGPARPLPPETDLSAYRIVQEAVTNAVRHAHAATCRVVLDQRGDELGIEVTDDGRGGPLGPGFGITGMRERAALLHGAFSAGPRPEGGFRVTARLPLPAEAVRLPAPGPSDGLVPDAQASR